MRCCHSHSALNPIKVLKTASYCANKEVLRPQEMGNVTRCGDNIVTWILRDRPPFLRLNSAPKMDKNRAGAIAYQPGSSVNWSCDSVGPPSDHYQVTSLFCQQPTTNDQEPKLLRVHCPIINLYIIDHSRPETACFKITARTDAQAI